MTCYYTVLELEMKVKTLQHSQTFNPLQSANIQMFRRLKGCSLIQQAQVTMKIKSNFLTVWKWKWKEHLKFHFQRLNQRRQNENILSVPSLRQVLRCGVTFSANWSQEVASTVDPAGLYIKMDRLGAPVITVQSMWRSGKPTSLRMSL